MTKVEAVKKCSFIKRKNTTKIRRKTSGWWGGLSSGVTAGPAGARHLRKRIWYHRTDRTDGRPSSDHLRCPGVNAQRCQQNWTWYKFLQKNHHSWVPAPLQSFWTTFIDTSPVGAPSVSPVSFLRLHHLFHFVSIVCLVSIRCRAEAVSSWYRSLEIRVWSRGTRVVFTEQERNEDGWPDYWGHGPNKNWWIEKTEQ